MTSVGVRFAKLLLIIFLAAYAYRAISMAVESGWDVAQSKYLSWENVGVITLAILAVEWLEHRSDKKVRSTSKTFKSLGK